MQFNIVINKIISLHLHFNKKNYLLKIEINFLKNLYKFFLAVEISFNIIVSIVSYAIPFCGFLYWYASVPYFLWKRKENTGLR